MCKDMQYGVSSVMYCAQPRETLARTLSSRPSQSSDKR